MPRHVCAVLHAPTCREQHQVFLTGRLRDTYSGYTILLRVPVTVDKQLQTLHNRLQAKGVDAHPQVARGTQENRQLLRA